MRCSIRLTLVGKFAGATLAALFRTVYAAMPPQSIAVRVARRTWIRNRGARATGHRPAIEVIWTAPTAQRLAERLGWRVGKPAMDAKLAAWKRWLNYRKASGAYAADRES